MEEEEAKELGGMVGGGVLDRAVGAGVWDGDRSGDTESRAGETWRDDRRGGSSLSGERRSSKMEVRSGERRASREESAMCSMLSAVTRICGLLAGWMLWWWTLW